MRKILASLAIVMLAGCASAQTVDLATLSKGAFTARTAYAVALTGMNQYAALPRCEKPNPPPCSNQAVVNIMRQVDSAADNATMAAERAVRDLKADPTVVQALVLSAQTAVSAMTAINATKGN